MAHLQRRPFGARARGEEGVALIVALMATTLLMALGIALTMTTMTEGKIASNYRDGTEAIYAADAAIERVMQDILTVPDWNNILNTASPLTASSAQPARNERPPKGVTAPQALTPLKLRM